MTNFHCALSLKVYGTRHHDTRAEQRNELHLASGQAKLTTAELLQEGMAAEKNKYVYEVDIPELKPDRVYVVQVKATNRYTNWQLTNNYIH